MPRPCAVNYDPARLEQVLSEGLRHNPWDPALVSDEEALSWNQLEQVSDCYAANLLSAGLRLGDRFASLMPNCTSLVIHYLGCFKAGIVATPLNYRYTASEIDHALKVSGARSLLLHASRKTDVDTCKAISGLPLGLISCGASGISELDLEGLLGDVESTADLLTPEPTAPAMIFFTSGSTGPAKGVTHSVGSLGWLIDAFRQGTRTTADDTVLLGGSMSHIGSFLDAFMGLSAGAGVIIPRSFDPDGLLPMFERHKPTVFMTLPSILFALVRDSRTSRNHLQSLRLCSAGGDKVSAELEREFEGLTGQSVNEQYGMSEVGIASINPPESRNKIGSMGRAIEGYQLSVRAADGSEQVPNTEGRLWVKSPGNMIGYWESPEATAATIKDGWLDTGDIVRIDPDGYVWFCGRQKQMIIHDGSNIIPQEVEDALLAHPAVEMAGVVGVPDLLHGENVQAFVTLKESIPMISPDELISFARNRVGYKAPQVIVVLDRMPLNASEKIDRAALRKLIGLTSQN